MAGERFLIDNTVLEDSESLPEPEILAAEIIEDIEAALEQFREVLEDLTVADVLTK